MSIKLNKTLLALCEKVDSEPSRTSKIVIFAKANNDFKFNYFCKISCTRLLTGFLMRPLVVLPILILHHIKMGARGRWYVNRVYVDVVMVVGFFEHESFFGFLHDIMG